MNELRMRGSVVDALSSALDQGGHGLSTVPALLRRVLSEESWREFETLRGEVIRHDRFADFVTLPPLKGLGASVDLVRRVVEDDVEAVDLLDRALQAKHGGDRSKSDNIPLARDTNQRGTSKDGALRRLRKDAPELHAEVLAGNLTAHAAMVKAGFRRPTATVRLDDPHSIASTLRRRLDPDVVREVARLLDDD